MIYLFLFVLLFTLILIYFKIADHLNIIDKPNQRSSHTKITIRGGGVVFYLAAVCYFIFSGFQSPFFFIGLSLMALVSFLDDVYTLSNKIRILIHLLAVSLLLYQLNLFQQSWYVPIIAIVLIVGIVNAYNFMDGINGITACNSFAVLFLLWLANQKYSFIPDDYLYLTAIGNFVFFIFNFRNRAKCFAGDVGSVSMAFILLYPLSLLILQSQQLIYLLFLGVYGVDVVVTIIVRLFRRENIFEAHRRHLYQYLANEVGLNRLLISTIYGLLQFIIGYLVLELGAEASAARQWQMAIALSLSLLAIYLGLRHYIYNTYVKGVQTIKR